MTTKISESSLGRSVEAGDPHDVEREELQSGNEIDEFPDGFTYSSNLSCSTPSEHFLMTEIPIDDVDNETKQKLHTDLHTNARLVIQRSSENSITSCDQLNKSESVRDASFEQTSESHLKPSEDNELHSDLQADPAIAAMSPVLSSTTFKTSNKGNESVRLEKSNANRTIRTGSVQQRRHPRCLHLMESISECPANSFAESSNIVTDHDSNAGGDSPFCVNHCNASFSDASERNSDQDAQITASNVNNTPTRRRRSYLSENGSTNIGSLPVSLGRSSRNISRSPFFRSGDSNQSCLTTSNESMSNSIERSYDNVYDDSERKKKQSNPLVASLDAGMMTLRRWIRSRTRSSRCAEAERSATITSVTGIYLGEEDFTALSNAGENHRGSSISSSSNVLDSSSINGFLYYRPFEIETSINSGTIVYDSDDESGIQHLVPSSSANRNRQRQQTRQRSFSEPDRARLLDFFSSVYGSRAIDGRQARTRYQSSTTSNNTQQSSGQSSVMTQGRRFFMSALSSELIEDEIYLTDHVHDQTADSLTVSSSHEIVPHLTTPLNERRSDPPPPELEDSSAHSSLPEAMESSPNNINATTNVGTPVTSDPNRRARNYWIRVNRRFQLTIRFVGLIFSFLLFGILVCWVFLITCYVISLDKLCDVPLKAYFWLSTLQLVLDIFRSDIMKRMCRYRSDSQHRVPLRIIFYNFAYLLYAVMILRLGVRSVFFTGTSTCARTAPELYFVSTIFICINLAAWATIFLGYVLPFCVVAILLTRNGYFPNSDETILSNGDMEGTRARFSVGMRGVVEFPNAYSNPAPSDCIEKLRVVLLDEFPASFPKECCICMMVFTAGEVIVQTPCDHIFHKRCCHEWLQLARTCPVCRTDVPSASGMNEGSTADEHDSSVSDVESGHVRNNEAIEHQRAYGQELNEEVSNITQLVWHDRLVYPSVIEVPVRVTFRGANNGNSDSIEL